MIIPISLLFVTGCSGEVLEEPVIEEPEIEGPVTDGPAGTLKGVSLSPRSSSAEDFTGFFEEAVEAGEIVMWAGDWQELSVDQGAPKVVTELASSYGYLPLVEVTIHSAGELVRPLDGDNLQMYRSRALAFAAEYQPKYLGLGIEINGLYRKSPADFEKFVPFYHEVYDAVKEISPGTQVFTVFQLELMKGLTMWEIEENEEHWELIDRFESDLTAFTTYPGLFYRDPSTIPRDHYLEIQSHTTKPVAFTEIGWHSAASPQGWESSEPEQAEFIQTFFNLTEDLNTEVLIWSFLYDPETIEPFRSMGLRRDDGTARPSWNAWIKD
jgi:hypothetical protein